MVRWVIEGSVLIAITNAEISYRGKRSIAFANDVRP